MTTDWVTAEIQRIGGPLARNLERLRAQADCSAGPGTPAFAPYEAFHRAWHDGTVGDSDRMIREAAAEEASQGVMP
jgi:hypothetical protein